MKKIIGYLRLTRPANLVTSVADVLAGITLSGYFNRSLSEDGYFLPVAALCLSTIGLYGGGVVFNDVFDARLDAVERPERPIPSGLIHIRKAAILGVLLLLTGILAAGAVNRTSDWLAFAIALAALIYDKWGKHHFILGPLNMGICRGLNLLLGMSILGHINPQAGWIAIIPIVYIASITMISRGEVHGGKTNALYLAAALYAFVIASILVFAWSNGAWIPTLFFLAFFAWMIFVPLRKAIFQPIGKNIGKAVRSGVIALIIMDASWAAAFGSLLLAFIILLLLPLSVWLSKLFSVT